MHVFPGIKRGTTFISEIGFLYKDSEIFIDAHARTNASYFSKQWSMLVDDVEIAENGYVSTKDGLTVHRSARGARITVPGELDVNVTIVAPSYGPRGSGANSVLSYPFHLSVKSLKAIAVPRSQTYQETKQTYKKLHDARGKHGHKASEALVDGNMEDYLTSDILTPDCKYTQFEGRKNIVKRIHRVLMSTAGVIFSSDAGQEEIVDSCTGFGHELDCKMDLDF
ncbi:hypothetical protein AXG93_3384s1560 [Marchantia polymorpha subsp. ruderalis]|uniref:Uncharacterized protein n=1 Tax=Marchantia polymorpha subsp. ruderalis TaxID=1480154 RepID=A0A176WH70_MARPO|nr:hypothetical protein AXG93_3384s1560 [Marchantia polymorpha subsp. ruderalis]